MGRTVNRVLLLLALAALGLLLLYVPTQLIDLYERAGRLGPFWASLYLGTVLLGGLLLLISSGWIVWRVARVTAKKRRRRAVQQKDPSQLSRAEQEEELRANLRLVEELEHDLTIPFELREELRPLADQLSRKQTDQRLEIVAFGTISSGKSSVLNALAGRNVFATEVRGGTTIQRNEIPWPGSDQVYLVDTPGLGEVDGQTRSRMATEAARDADLVLLVVDGPLRASEFDLLKRLKAMEKRIIVCLNKSDWYVPADLEALRKQLIEQTRGLVDEKDVVTVRAETTTRVRRRVMPDERETEERVEVPADMQPLAARMLARVRRDGRDLLLANMLLQSRGLVEKAKERLQEALDRRAYQIVDRYMWTVGGAAALMPFPVVDLAAGVAISSKMVVDLARVYRQDIDLDAAVKLLGQQGKNLLGVLGAGAATPVVVSTVASLIKTVPGAGTLAGGMMQGVVQALITRWIGNVFIEYFRREMQEPPGGLANLARREWERVTSLEEMRRLVATARDRLEETDADT